MAVSEPWIVAGEIWRLLTAHWLNGDPIHGLFTLILIGFLFRPVSDTTGTAPLLKTMAIGQLICAIVTLLIEGEFWGFRTASYVLLTAFATIAPQARMIFFFIPMPAWLLVSIVIAADVLIGVATQGWVWHLMPLIGVLLGFGLIRYRHILNRLKRQRQQQQATNNNNTAITTMPNSTASSAKVNQVGIGELHQT